MTETTIDQAGGVPAVGVVEEVEEEVAGQLVQRARAEGLTLTGPDGLLGRLPKMVLETALDAEMTEHLGDEPHERAGVSNACHGTRAEDCAHRGRPGRESTCRGTATARSSRRSWRSGSDG